MQGNPRLYELLEQLQVPFKYVEHPPAPTIEDVMKFWNPEEATHCKNLFFRNHKGNRHYLVILNALQNLDIHDLEKRLKQGKISFASEQRMEKYLGVKPGSVTPFGLINDAEHHVHVFLDDQLKKSPRLSFHPLVNTASLIVSNTGFMRFMDWTTNTYEFLDLY